MIQFHTLNKKEVLKYFSIDENKGVSSHNLDQRYEKYGQNIVSVEDDLSFWDLYLVQIRSFLNLLLIFLVLFAFVVWFNTKEFEYLVDSTIIFIIFLVNTIIGAYENYNSRKIAKTLSSMLLSKVNVIRDGIKVEISSTKLACGDIVLLKGGDKIPADCYLLKSNNLKIDESILTGESISVKKEVCKLNDDIEITNMKNMLFMNTFVVSGDAIACVVKVGEDTQIGKIAQSLKVKKKKISFLDEIDDASKTISKFAIILIAIVSLVLILKGFDIIEVFLIASALIIGSVPEGLPAIVVFLLSRSIHSLAKKNILVKDMGLLETLGSVNILCTDKTGTLTTNLMSVKKMFTNFQVYEMLDDIDDFCLDKISKIAYLANEAEYINNNFGGEPEDVALINFLSKKYDFLKVRDENKIDKFEPFSSENKTVMAQSQNITYKKGALNVILDECNYIVENNEIRKLTSQDIDTINLESKKFSDDALRLIAFSYIEEDKNIFVGFTGLYDKPKDGIKKTITALYNSKIDVKMVTGDNLNTALSIARECGFRNPKGVLFSDIKDLNDTDLKKKVIECNVFAQVLPEYKEKIVKILQDEGNRVAITGDGVNDTIALRDADVGIVMGSGSDIAKESSDMILLNNDFNEIPLAVREGRGIFVNIRKVINYLLTANLAEVLVIFFASFLGIIPLSAIQILWVNFVTDVFPALSLGVDKYPYDIMKTKPTGKDENILNNRIKLLTLFISIKKVILIFLIYYIGYYYSNQDVVFAQTVAFTWLVLTHFIRIAAIRFDEKISIFTNKYVMLSIIVVLLVQLILIYTPLRVFFGIVTIPIAFWAVLIIAILIGVFFAKLIANLVDYLLIDKKAIQD